MRIQKVLCALLLAIAIAGPAYAGDDDTQFVAAKLVWLQHSKTTVYQHEDANYTPTYSTQTKTYRFVVKIGDTHYIGEAEKDKSASGRLAAAISRVGNFNEKDWANLDTNDVMVRFEKKGVGWRQLAMTVKQPNGKENTMWLRQIIGADGKDQCGKKTGCTGHNWDEVPHPGN